LLDLVDKHVWPDWPAAIEVALLSEKS